MRGSLELRRVFTFLSGWKQEQRAQNEVGGENCVTSTRRGPQKTRNDLLEGGPPPAPPRCVLRGPLHTGAPAGLVRDCLGLQ